MTMLNLVLGVPCFPSRRRLTGEICEMKPTSVKDLDVYAVGAGVRGATRSIEAQVGVKVDVAILHLHKKDPRLARMRKIIRLFNAALTEARKLNLPIDGVPIVLRGVLEEDPAPYLSGVVGEFWMQYAAFESIYSTRGPGTKKKMLSFYTDGDGPFPYDVRNWLGHLGRQPLDKYKLSDVQDSCNLLRKWNANSNDG